MQSHHVLDINITSVMPPFDGCSHKLIASNFGSRILWPLSNVSKDLNHLILRLIDCTSKVDNVLKVMWLALSYSTVGPF